MGKIRKQLKNPSNSKINTIIIDRETGDKLSKFHEELEEFIFKINEKYSLNYYELVGVLDTIKFSLHADAIQGGDDED